MDDIPQIKIDTLRKRLMQWGKNNTRDFPWRKNLTPYSVLISEIMLHRTRAKQVVDKYLIFMKKYPDFKSICNAELNEIKKDLRSLGLYWRTEMLYALACFVCEKYHCELPLNKEELMKLPGIGEYISSAILCFVCNISAPILDTNTVRIISRVFGIEMNDSSRRSKKYMNIMKRIIDSVPCRDFSYAMIDFGSLICKKINPQCDNCPLQDICNYYLENVKTGDGNVSHKR